MLGVVELGRDGWVMRAMVEAGLPRWMSGRSADTISQVEQKTAGLTATEGDDCHKLSFFPVSFRNKEAAYRSGHE